MIKNSRVLIERSCNSSGVIVIVYTGVKFHDLICRLTKGQNGGYIHLFPLLSCAARKVKGDRIETELEE